MFTYTNSNQVQPQSSQPAGNVAMTSYTATNMQPTSQQNGTVGVPVPPGFEFVANPGGTQFMPAPQSIPMGVPPGLEYLLQVDQLLVHQQIELFELLTGFETTNRYQVKNSLGQQVFFAAEESSCAMRYFCGARRGFVIHITDNFGKEVIRVIRDFKCCAGCNYFVACRFNCLAGCQCCAMEIRVEAPVGETIGYLKQQRSCWATRYYVEDVDHHHVFTVQGPCCPCQTICCTADVEFKVLSTTGHEVGVIAKQWGGYLKEMLVDADNFSVTFPMDLDVRLKATLLGSVFLIDFMFFEQKQQRHY